MTIESLGAMLILFAECLCFRRFVRPPLACPSGRKSPGNPLEMPQRLLGGARPRVAREYRGGPRKLLAAGRGGAQEPAESRGGGLDIAAWHVFSRPRVHFACDRRVE